MQTMNNSPARIGKSKGKKCAPKKKGKGAKRRPGLAMRPY